MIKISNPLSPIFDSLSKSINRMIVFTFAFVLLLPLIFLFPSLESNSWDVVHKDNLAKHKLLATSLAEPIGLHINSYQNSLRSLGDSLAATEINSSGNTEVQLINFVEYSDNVVAASFVKTNDESVVTVRHKSYKLSSRKKANAPVLDYILDENKYRKYDKVGSTSSVFKSSVSKKPVILIKHHIFDETFNKLGTLMAEINLSYVQKLCSQITFGDNGHCTVVDDKGKTIAHPNAAWVTQIKNISSNEVVKKIKANSSGSLEYLSTESNEVVIAGFAKVDKLDWGVMVLRPKAEIDLPFKNIITGALSWVAAGTLVAFLIAFFVTRKITRPLSILVAKSKELDTRSESFHLGAIPDNCPKEVSTLWDTISKLLASYKKVNSDLNVMNSSISGSMDKDLRKVVTEHRERNLKETSNKDLLTKITNRTCFDKEMNRVLLTHKGDEVGVILLDINNYQSFVSNHGQDAGNHVLQHIAQVLSRNIRTADMVARYDDNDKFVVYLNKCNPRSLQGTAEKLRKLVRKRPIIWDQSPVYFNLSIGTVCHEVTVVFTLDSLMNVAENALIESKSEEQDIKPAQQSNIQVA